MLKLPHNSISESNAKPNDPLVAGLMLLILGRGLAVTDFLMLA